MTSEQGAGRVAFNVRLSEEARTGWNTYAEENRVSVSALLEAIGADLSTESDALAAYVESAQRIDALRRRRRTE